MELRELNAEDLFKLTEIAEQISADLVMKMAAEINEKQMGIQIFASMLRIVPNEIKAFLAHITDQSPEELDKKSFAEPIRILRALYAKEEFKDFLLEMNSLRSEVSLK